VRRAVHLVDHTVRTVLLVDMLEYACISTTFKSAQRKRGQNNSWWTVSPDIRIRGNGGRHISETREGKSMGYCVSEGATSHDTFLSKSDPRRSITAQIL